MAYLFYPSGWGADFVQKIRKLFPSQKCQVTKPLLIHEAPTPIRKWAGVRVTVFLRSNTPSDRPRRIEIYFLVFSKFTQTITGPASPSRESQEFIRGLSRPHRECSRQSVVAGCLSTGNVLWQGGKHRLGGRLNQRS